MSWSNNPPAMDTNVMMMQTREMYGTMAFDFLTGGAGAASGAWAGRGEGSADPSVDGLALFNRGRNKTASLNHQVGGD